ncbi:hypothetical protein BDV29DRAFT_68931 [Aspergillus leporis]|uniref:Uncharacterized protein n=1 Tax=Aspergillus leporis TaxID=41062 RepID=A0A5N5WIX3_9EURO|nr:hypothetical protein BDV29DRAFT_68931 [Aspergillus leporis]
MASQKPCSGLYLADALLGAPLSILLPQLDSHCRWHTAGRGVCYVSQVAAVHFVAANVIQTLVWFLHDGPIVQTLSPLTTTVVFTGKSSVTPCSLSSDTICILFHDITADGMYCTTRGSVQLRLPFFFNSVKILKTTICFSSKSPAISHSIDIYLLSSSQL